MAGWLAFAVREFAKIPEEHMQNRVIPKRAFARASFVNFILFFSLHQNNLWAVGKAPVL
jgi:hypothetical protein